MERNEIEAGLALLTEMMEGVRCEDAARRAGRSTTQARRLALGVVKLAAMAGRLEFAAPEELKSLKRLRCRHGPAVIESLRDFDGSGVRMPQTLTMGAIDAGLARLSARSAHPQRDAAMLCTILATGLRPAELVRLTVADCLSWDGEIRKEIKVRAEVSLSGKQRTVYFVARRQVLALEAYLVQRAPPREQTQGVGFRGLPPGEVLFVGDQGQGFKVLPRPGGGVPISPRAFEVVAQIFADAGWPSMTCSRVRRELRKRLMDRHARQEEIAAMLDCSPGRQVVRRRPALRSVAAATMDVL